jgi:hypothetical protein
MVVSLLSGRAGITTGARFASHVPALAWAAVSSSPLQFRRPYRPHKARHALHGPLETSLGGCDGGVQPEAISPLDPSVLCEFAQTFGRFRTQGCHLRR